MSLSIKLSRYAAAMNHVSENSSICSSMTLRGRHCRPSEEGSIGRLAPELSLSSHFSIMPLQTLCLILHGHVCDARAWASTRPRKLMSSDLIRCLLFIL